VVDRLASASQPADDGVTWHTRPELLPPWQRELCPEGYFNLGLAHGVPGVVGVLGAIAAAGQGETSTRARSLGDAATRWLRARRMPAHPRGRFASWLGVGEQSPEPARTAWCYGDPGVAVAAWSAAIRTGADEGEWRDLALESMQRPLEHAGIIDPNLCHGAAGLGHLCNRFYQASGDPRFRDAGRGWFERVLAMRRPGEGIAGFTTLRPAAADGKRLQHEAVPDFLDGTAGVALALLAALRAEEPGWDRLLLCDLPPRGA
jgi:lantibiotic biosynthesis protein